MSYNEKLKIILYKLARKKFGGCQEAILAFNNEAPNPNVLGRNITTEEIIEIYKKILGLECVTDSELKKLCNKKLSIEDSFWSR